MWSLLQVEAGGGAATAFHSGWVGGGYSGTSLLVQCQKENLSAGGLQLQTCLPCDKRLGRRESEELCRAGFFFGGGGA